MRAVHHRKLIYENNERVTPFPSILVIILAFFFLGIPDFGYILTILLIVLGLCLLLPYFAQKQRDSIRNMRNPVRYQPINQNQNQNVVVNITNTIPQQIQPQYPYQSNQQKTYAEEEPNMDDGMEMNEKYCEYCGKELNPDARFCDGCGKQQ